MWWHCVVSSGWLAALDEESLGSLGWKLDDSRVCQLKHLKSSVFFSTCVSCTYFYKEIITSTTKSPLSRLEYHTFLSHKNPIFVSSAIFHTNHNVSNKPNVGPSGQSVPAQVSQTADGLFKADFVPRLVGEHRVSVTVQGLPTAGSPYAAKVCI